ncbi:MAG: BTAD domain-containing putative transcriptional regulator [Rhodoglobus sp.]
MTSVPADSTPEVDTWDHAAMDYPVIPRVCLIGGVAVESETERIDSGVITSARSRRILAALVDNPGGLSARRLAERVWPDPPATWPSALRGAIASLRAALEPLGLDGSQLIVTTGNGWALASGVSTDLHESELAIQRAEIAVAAGTTSAGLAVQGALQSVLHGEILGDDDAEWLDGLRERRRRCIERCRHLIAEAALSAARPELALEQADALLAVSPVDETAHRIRIRARRSRGDRAGAIEAFELCRSALAEHLGIDPSPETVAVYLDVLQSGSGNSGTLPPLPIDGFFGRAAELSMVLAGLSTPGVVELTGRGGVGKTRLALHAAHELDAEGGCFWASLGDLTAGELVAVAVAEATGAPTGGSLITAIVEHLAPLGPVLLVLDGGEKVVDDTVDVITALREAIPQLRILVTTRVPLSSGWMRIPLSALSSADPERSPALLLIADRVAARGGRLATDPRSLAALNELCLRCEGIPLALELAAAQLAGMAVVDLLDELPDVAAGADGVLRAMLDQARAALDVEELAVFDRLAVVDGTVPLSLVRGLVRGAVPAGRTARHLTALADSGLLAVVRGGARWRYGLDDELRRLVREAAAPPRDVYDGLADALDAIAPADATSPPAAYRDAVDDAGDGFRTLFRAAADGDADLLHALDLGYRLHRYWTVTRMAEGRYWLRQLLAGAPEGPATARARFAAGYLGYWSADPDALALLRSAASDLGADAPAIAARALIYAAGLADDLDFADDASRDILRAVELARLGGGGGLIAAATTGVGAILAERGDPAAVGYCAEAVEAMGPETPVEQRQALLANCARLAWQVGDLATARAWAKQASPLLDGPPRIATSQLASTLAALDLADGALDSALEYAKQAVSVARELELDRELPLVLAIASRVSLARGELDEATNLALSCLDSSTATGTRWTLAIALETCAALLAGGYPDDAATLVRSAETLRVAGSRPAPVTLLLSTPPSGDVVAPEAAATLARDLLVRD